MRWSSFQDCLTVLGHYGVPLAPARAIDVGGTREVALKKGDRIAVSQNPLLELIPDVLFLDRGFNAEIFGTEADEEADFLDPAVIGRLKDSFDLVFCFDVLEHVSNPFRFCDHLVRIARPGGYVYAATVFSYEYHPSPEDYYRFSPMGLRQCFIDPACGSRDGITVLWNGWESEPQGVGILVYKGTDLERAAAPGLTLGRPGPARSGVLKAGLKKSVRAARGLMRRAPKKPDGSGRER